MAPTAGARFLERFSPERRAYLDLKLRARRLQASRRARTASRRQARHVLPPAPSPRETARRRRRAAARHALWSSRAPPARERERDRDKRSDDKQAARVLTPRTPSRDSLDEAAETSPRPKADWTPRSDFLWGRRLADDSLSEPNRTAARAPPPSDAFRGGWRPRRDVAAALAQRRAICGRRQDLAERPRGPATAQPPRASYPTCDRRRRTPRS